MSSGRPRTEPSIRFWKYVQKTDSCWLWAGCRDKNGYGKFWYDKHGRAHRFAYERLVGPVRDDEMVLHHCDNPPCCNPSHLFKGTAEDNSHDMIRKGRDRAPKGEDCGRAKLTADQVREIRSRFQTENVSKRQLGRDYGVSPAAVHLIIKRTNWASV